MEKNKKDKIVNIITNTIFTINMIIVSLMALSIIYMYCFNKLDVKEYKPVSLNIQPMEYTITKDEAKQLIKDLYNTPHFYKETNRMSSDRGAENYSVIRYVKVRPNLDVSDYVIYYAHELTHLKFMYGDETMTVFKTFVMLYESGNAELQHMALMDAQGIVNGGYRGTDYDCGYYIIEYLKEIGYLNDI